VSPIIQVLKFRVVSDSAARRIAQIACYIAAIAILPLGIRRLATLQLEEAKLLIGVLMVIAVAVLFVVAGTLVRAAQPPDRTAQ
jgi:hypothetical protein